MAKELVFGPTYEEMLHPDTIDPKIRAKALEAKHKGEELDPITLFNINWRHEDGKKVRYMVIPKEITGVDCNIAVIYGSEFPTGSHKVGATYSVTMENQLSKDFVPGQHTVVWPSTGNYGIGGAWVSGRMKYDGIVLLPELMSEERFKKIEGYGCRYIKTPGCESNVKEIYDKSKELALQPNVRVANQFEQFANYRFHYYVTGNSILDAVKEMTAEGLGNGRVAAFVSSMGSAGTIAAADRLKEEFYECKIVGVEPTQCPTLFCNGFGGHDIQGIGDKHVTWIHNVCNMDAMLCVDDMECKKGLQLLTDDEGVKYLVDKIGVDAEKMKLLRTIVGISGSCNILSAIKVAKFYDFGPEETVWTVCTDTIDRYHTVMKQLDEEFGKVDFARSQLYHHIFLDQKIDWMQEGTVLNRKRWLNLKYYTWIEQQGKKTEELVAQRRQDYWLKEQKKVKEVDAAQIKARGY